MNLKPPSRPQTPPAPISMVPSIISKFKILKSQKETPRQTIGDTEKDTEPSAIRPRKKGSNLVNTILRIFSTIQKLDVLCYTCLNHIFIRFQYSSQLLNPRGFAHPATKSLSRAFSSSGSSVCNTPTSDILKRYLLRNKVYQSCFQICLYFISLEPQRSH